MKKPEEGKKLDDAGEESKPALSNDELQIFAQARTPTRDTHEPLMLLVSQMVVEIHT